MELKRQLGLATAILIIIADVIGTGIFMTTGQVLGMTGNALTVLILFGVGGIIALTGSLCYGELATMWPDDGGEYVYLKKIFGPLPSFLTGWISMFIGFSLSAAMSAIIAINYINELSTGGIITGVWAPKFAAAGIVLVFSIIHVIGVQKGSFIQNVLTVLKLLIVFAFVAFGFYMADWSHSGRLVMEYSIPENRSIMSYGAGLIVIMYAYSGWNGITYIAGEIKNPDRNLPKALFYGTLLITVIYILMNVVFLISSSGNEIITEGKNTIGSLAAKNLFGELFYPIFNICIVIILLSSVSVQMMIGPRVIYAMAKDRAIFKSLGRINTKYQTPDLAIIIQMSIAIFYVFIGFNAILKMLIYIGFALSIFPLLAVIGMVYLRYKRPEIERPFKVPFFPIIPAVFIILTIIIIVTTFILTTFIRKDDYSTLFAIGVMSVGIIIFFIWRRGVRE